MTKLPLTLALAGLGETHERIGSMGLTQGVQTRSLGGFTYEETNFLINKWCAHFGIRIGDRRSEIDTLMKTTDGWPRHVHWAQKALAEALLVEGVEGDADRITDWASVQAQSDRLRQGYYNTQYSDVMKRARSLTIKIIWDVAKADAAGKGLSLEDVIEKVDEACNPEQGGTYCMPRGYKEETFVIHLIHCGALDEDPDSGVLTCPIPNFQNYVLHRRGKDPSLLRLPCNSEHKASSSID